MDTIAKIREKAKSKVKTIILPEVDDKRVKEACKFINKQGIAKAILLGRKDLDKKRIKQFAEQYFQLRKHKGITKLQASETVKIPLYYAAMMARAGLADGFVAGASLTSPNVIKAAIRCLQPDQAIGTVSSCFIMVVPDIKYGEKGVLFFADCGVIPSPSPIQLANIAISTANLASKVLGFIPRIAMLSYSTKGSAKGRLVDNVKKAAQLVKDMKPGLIIDGELQVDSALVPQVAVRKAADSPIRGDANILIFPNLEAGNIGYKLVQRLANARAIGPVLQGLKRPCSDLSRGCSIDDIIDCVAVTAIMAQN